MISADVLRRWLDLVEHARRTQDDEEVRQDDLKQLESELFDAWRSAMRKEVG